MSVEQVVLQLGLDLAQGGLSFSISTWVLTIRCMCSSARRVLACPRMSRIRRLTAHDAPLRPDVPELNKKF